MTATFSERLVKARSSLGWSQAQLSEACGISPTQISRYESSISAPRPQAIGKLAKALNVNFDWLAKGVGAIDSLQLERSTAAPNGWSQVELEIPKDLMAWLEKSAQSFGVSTESRLLQLLQNSVDAERSSKNTDSLGDIVQRLAALEKQTKELASKVKFPEPATPPKKS